MMSDTAYTALSPRSGKSSSRFLPSFRSIIRSASSLASTVRSAGSSVASTIILADEDRQCEEVQWAGFDRIELGRADIRRVLLLTYLNGFQVWDVEDANDVWELVSKRDGPVAFLRVQPQPFPETCDGMLKAARPLLLVVTTDSTPCRSSGVHSGLSNGCSPVAGSSPSPVENPFIPTLVKFYSLRSHTYVHTLRFRTAIYAVRCSSRIVAVALAAQLYCFDAETLQSTFSVLTYPLPQPGSNTLNFGYGAMAVGPRWLAYAANQPLVSNTGRVSPQHLSPSPGVSPSTSPANASLVTHYAKESSKQIAAGIVTLGDLGYKAISRYYSDGSGSPVQGSPFLKGTSNGYPEHAGTVIVRDFVTKAVISQFRAHTSPLSALCFNPTGTLLVTASIHGHTINVFRIMPVTNMNGANTGVYDASAAHIHLYKLSRGMTNAVIQDIAFSEDSHWIAVSSTRGTNHLFAISPFGGTAKPTTKADHVFGANKPWWSNMGLIKSNQQTYSFAPPSTVHASAISRIKNGNSGWCGTVIDAAAAAAATASNGKMSTSLGPAAVAVTFHDGGGHKPEIVGGDHNGLKEQLWVLSSSGHLIRYGLHLTEGYVENILPSQNSSIEAPADVRVMVEPLQKWDVCRRLNWVEREEKIDNTGTNVSHDVPSCANAGSCYNNGAFADREDFISSEMRQLFLSNAEVSMHHFKPPVWAKSQVCFQVFIDTGTDGAESAGGEVEIEKFNTRVVKVRNRDLVPVFDRFKEYQFGEDPRDNSLMCSKDDLPSRVLYSSIPNGIMDVDIGVLPNQQSRSGGSCVSDGSVYNSSNVAAHQPYQDSPAQLIPSFLQSPGHGETTMTLQGAYFAGINTIRGGGANTEASLSGKIEQRKIEHVFSNAKRSAMTLVMENGTSFASTNGHINVSDKFLTKHPESNIITLGSPRDGAGSHAYDSSGSDKILSNGNVLDQVDSFGLHEYDVPTEEVESNDGNSKSEEHGEDGWDGAIEGEDGWEGAMFPFAEDC